MNTRSARAEAHAVVTALDRVANQTACGKTKTAMRAPVVHRDRYAGFGAVENNLLAKQFATEQLPAHFRAASGDIPVVTRIFHGLRKRAANRNGERRIVHGVCPVE